MTDDNHLDGNALGGLFHDLFGQEMTDALGCCDECGTVSALGAIKVFRGAGEVLRCPACGNIMMVIVSTPAELHITFQSLRWLNTPRPV